MLVGGIRDFGVGSMIGWEEVESFYNLGIFWWFVYVKIEFFFGFRFWVKNIGVLEDDKNYLLINWIFEGCEFLENFLGRLKL